MEGRDAEDKVIMHYLAQEIARDLADEVAALEAESAAVQAEEPPPPDRGDMEAAHEVWMLEVPVVRAGAVAAVVSEAAEEAARRKLGLAEAALEKARLVHKTAHDAKLLLVAAAKRANAAAASRAAAPAARRGGARGHRVGGARPGSTTRADL